MTIRNHMNTEFIILRTGHSADELPDIVIQWLWINPAVVGALTKALLKTENQK